GARNMISCRSASIPTPHITRPSIPDIPDGSDSAELEVVRILVRFDIDDRRALAHEQLRDRAASVGACGVLLSVGLRDSVDGDERVGREVEAVARWFLVQFDFDAHPGQDIELVAGEHDLHRLAESVRPGHTEVTIAVL